MTLNLLDCSVWYFIYTRFGSSARVHFSCIATKQLFQNIGVKAKVIELDTMSNGSDIQAALETFTGQRTVPNVFIKGKHVGGNDKTQAAHKSGELQRLLSA